MQMKRLHLPLLENAISFASEALKEAISAETDPVRWKFAILHLVQAIELSLKELLKREHWCLIFDKIENPKKTVTLDGARVRLKHVCSFVLSDAEDKDLKVAVAARNAIVHHEVNEKVVNLRLKFGKLLAFLNEFHRQHLDQALQDKLPSALWVRGARIRDYGQHLFTSALQRLESEGVEKIVVCGDCGWQSMAAEGDNIGTCYVCNFFHELVVCDRCREVFSIDDIHESSGGNHCYECFCYEQDRGDYLTHLHRDGD
jgi:hypothetical protein